MILTDPSYVSNAEPCREEGEGCAHPGVLDDEGEEAEKLAGVEEEEDGRVDAGRGGRARAVLGVSDSVSTTRM